MQEVQNIYIYPQQGLPGQSVKSVHAEHNMGLEGDHYCGTDSKKAVTLQEIEAIEDTGHAASDFRRNIITRGVHLNSLTGKRFFVGQAVLEGLELCQPCEHLSKMVGADMVKLLWNRGGLRAGIIKSGEICIGDTVSVIPYFAPRIISFKSSNENFFKMACNIRKAVFVTEQGVTPDLEYDGLDEDSSHFLLLCEPDFNKMRPASEAAPVADTTAAIKSDPTDRIGARTDNAGTRTDNAATAAPNPRITDFSALSFAPATARIRETAKGLKLERFAVLRQYRGLGYGRIMMDKLILHFGGIERFYFHAQAQVVPFYEKFGFQTSGEPFMEADIEHYLMIPAPSRAQ